MAGLLPPAVLLEDRNQSLGIALNIERRAGGAGEVEPAGGELWSRFLGECWDTLTYNNGYGAKPPNKRRWTST